MNLTLTSGNYLINLINHRNILFRTDHKAKWNDFKINSPIEHSAKRRNEFFPLVIGKILKSFNTLNKFFCIIPNDIVILA
ncbi:MAG: hypothetical protein ABI840_00675 [bacterium]